MRQVNKIINIALIFTLGIFLYQNIAYALRAPLITDLAEEATKRLKKSEIVERFRSQPKLFHDEQEVSVFVKELTDGKFEFKKARTIQITPKGGIKYVLLEVIEIGTGKSWFLRFSISEDNRTIRLAKHVARKQAKSLTLQNHLPELRFDPYSDDYYLACKEGDIPLDEAIEEERLSPDQIIKIGIQAMDIMAELKKSEPGDPGIYFGDNGNLSNYMVDRRDLLNPRLIFVDIGYEGLERFIGHKELLFRLYRSLPKNWQTIIDSEVITAKLGQDLEKYFTETSLALHGNTERVQDALMALVEDKDKMILHDSQFDSTDTRMGGTGEALQYYSLLEDVKDMLPRRLNKIGWGDPAETKIKISYFELSYNVIKHGIAGIVTLGYDKEKDAIEVISMDVGPGLGDPNVHLRNSIEKRRKASIERPRLTPPGMGFFNIIFLPDEVLLETGGRKYVKKGQTIEDLRLEYLGPSEVVRGTQILLRFTNKTRQDI